MSEKAESVREEMRDYCKQHPVLGTDEKSMVAWLSWHREKVLQYYREAGYIQ